jgi:hypothetical protein
MWEALRRRWGSMTYPFCRFVMLCPPMLLAPYMISTARCASRSRLALQEGYLFHRVAYHPNG